MDVKIKRLKAEAVIPAYAHISDAGLDLTAVSMDFDTENDVFVYGTGLAVEIPAGYVGLLFPRSSVYKKGLALTNCVGVIDSGYRGEILCKFSRRNGNPNKVYTVGDRIAQLIILPYPAVSFVEVEELNDSERGNAGYGSTGF